MNDKMMQKHLEEIKSLPRVKPHHLEPLARGLESRGIKVDRTNGARLTVYGDNGTAHVTPGTSWSAISFAFKMIGVLISWKGLVILLVAFAIGRMFFGLPSPF